MESAVAEALDHKAISPDSDLELTLGYEQCAYLKYDHTGVDKSIRITVKGSDSKSDGAVYVSASVPKPDHSTAKWKNSKYGLKRVDIHTSDADYVDGMYYISIAGNKNTANNIKVSISWFEPIEVTDISGSISQEVGIGKDALRHHSFKTNKTEGMKMEIHISPGWPKCVAYLSTRNANLPVSE